MKEDLAILMALCVLGVALFDVYQYSFMFNLTDQLSYVQLYYKIVFLIGFVRILCFICIAVNKCNLLAIVIVLGTAFFTNQLKFGTATYNYLKEDGFDVVLFSIPSNAIRRELFREHYSKIRRMPSFTTYYGMDKNQFNKTFLKTERDKGNYAYYLSLKEAFFTNFNISNPQKWILMFEDDAVTLPYFRNRLSATMYDFDGYDILWLDTTNSLGWVTLRKVYNGFTGIVFASNSLKKISALLEFDNPYYEKHIKHWSNENPPYYLDIVLAEYCNLGILTCAHSPIVHPSGLKSTIG